MKIDTIRELLKKVDTTAAPAFMQGQGRNKRDYLIL